MGRRPREKDWIRKFRLRYGMTQTEIAVLLHTSRPQISRMECGGDKTHDGTGAALRNALMAALINAPDSAVEHLRGVFQKHRRDFSRVAYEILAAVHGPIDARCGRCRARCTSCLQLPALDLEGANGKAETND